jgi:hypothetical protein
MLKWRKGIMSKKKKIIIGCIGAVVLLVLGSLSNVVGYQSVKSTGVNDSPLFQTRTQKATNQQQNTLTSQYLGMGNGNILQFSFRDNRTDLLKKVSIFFKNMDNKTFNIFTNIYLYQLQKKGEVTDVNREKIAEALRQFRDSSVRPIIYNNIEVNDMTWRDTPTLCWFPGCQLYILFLVIFITVMFSLISVVLGETSCITCISHCTNIPDMKDVCYLLNKM